MTLFFSIVIASIIFNILDGFGIIDKIEDFILNLLERSDFND